MYGYSERDAIGRNVSELMPDPDRSRHDSYIARYRATGKPHIIGIGRIVTGRRRDGTTFPMHLSIGEMRTAGEPFYTGFVARPHRASADPGAAAGAAVRTGPRLPPERDGRDGLGAGA